jgi:DNA invertase Pin-like site-specific DNA recombinase
MTGRPKLLVNTEEFTKMYKTHVSTADIAQHFGISLSSVRNTWIRLKIPKRKNCKVVFDEEEYRRLFNSGVIYPEIANKLGISKCFAIEIRKQLGLPARKRGAKRSDDGGS